MGADRDPRDVCRGHMRLGLGEMLGLGGGGQIREPSGRLSNYCRSFGRGGKQRLCTRLVAAKRGVPRN